MARAVRAVVLTAALLVTSAATPAVGDPTAERVAVCVVRAEQPDVERTAHVPPPVAEQLLATTPSYAAPRAPSTANPRRAGTGR